MVLIQMTMMKRVMSRGQFRPLTSSQKPATQQCPPASLHLHHQEERHNPAPSCLQPPRPSQGPYSYTAQSQQQSYRYETNTQQ